MSSMQSERGLRQELREAFETRWQDFYQQYYDETTPLHQAVRYSLEGQGKRVRPLLVLLSHKALGGQSDDSFLAAIAVEMVHTYSLIHDDLPCMDDDAMRRGRPTVHMAFDEATALLAGDALLTDAFGVLAQLKNRLAVKEAITELAGAIGGRGMVKGQSLDLYWTDKSGGSLETLGEIHNNKTGKLMGAACALGALTAGADERTIGRYRAFGQTIGLVFQIIDDILDPNHNLGKSAGKDAEQNKMSFLRFYGSGEGLAKARDLTDSALQLVQVGSQAPSELQIFAKSLVERAQ